MPKVMLVEDDNNLREIYDARLAAEGYEIVSAHDGEEALALAVKEKPDLIISDVMMPKISGFDMLDILRSTPETKNTKVIMMTALSQSEDRQRADKLGADRYLVKSQVTLEDVIKVAHEILNDSGPATSTPAPTAVPVTATVTNDAPVAAPPATPVADVPVATPPAPTTVPVVEPPAATPAPVVEPPAPAAPAEPTTTVTNVGPLTDDKKEEPKEEAPAAPTPEAPAPAAPLEAPTASAPPVPESTPEPATAPAPTPTPEAPAPVAETPPVPAPAPIDDKLTQTKSEEVDGVEKQIQDFVANNPTLTTATDASAPTPTDAPATPTPAPASTPTSIPVTTAPSDEPAPATPAPDPQDELSNPSGHTSSASNPEPPSHKKLVLTPTENALSPAVDLDALLAKENANESVPTPGTNTVITPSTDGEEAAPNAPSTTVSPNDISL